MEKNKINYTTTLVSISLIAVVVILLAFFPTEGLEVVSEVYALVTNTFGSALLWFSLITTFICGYLFFSKHGNIKLGNGKPEYSLFSYIAMIICSGLASASVIFSFVEWTYYYASPALGVGEETPLAAEYAMAYEFFHWGLASWPPFALAALPIAYSYYVRKNEGMRFSTVLEHMMVSRHKYTLGKVVDILFIVTIFGALGVTLGLGVPIISTVVSQITGLEDGFALNVFTVIAIAVLFSLSSFVGVDKGMKRVSDMNVYFCILFIAFILISGPTLFIIKSITNSLGLHFDNFFRMSLWTDPVNGGGFPEAWTMFFICFAISYAPLMALFITKISKGRKIKEVVGSVVLGGSVGSYLIFGINSGFAMDAHLTGKVDVLGLMAQPGGDAKAIIGILDQMVLPEVIAYCAFGLILILFLATSLDSASHSLSLASLKNEQTGDRSTAKLRLFWCIAITLLPLCMMFIGAPLGAIQTLAIVTGFPFAIVIIVFTIGLFRWLKEDAAVSKTGNQ